MKKRRKYSFLTVLSLCLIVLFAACGQHPTMNVDQINAKGTSSQITQMPATKTDCPADGTARAAVMRPFHLGKHANVVYIYNEIPLNTSTAFGHLKRYDVVTAQKTELVTSGIAIQSAQVSADGQWVLFLTTPDPRLDPQHSAMLQLVRMDGQGLQTLYCLPSANYSHATMPNVQWSPDQQSILITTDTHDTTSLVILLHVKTGKLETELNITDTQQLYRYSVLTWLDNTRAYVVKQGRQGPEPPRVLYILDTATNKDPYGSDLKQVLEHSARMSFLSFINSADGQKLFVSYCLLASNPFGTTISVGGAAGGLQQTIYHQANTICAEDMRVVSSKTLFVVGMRAAQNGNTYYNQAWTLGTDGSRRTVLFDTIRGSTDYSMDLYTQYPWSNISRDGGMYALQTRDNNGSLQTLVVGSLNGGNPTQFAYTSRGSVAIAGWTTM